MLKPPSFAPEAKADVRGWRDRRTGELLVSRRHTPEEVEAYERDRALSALAADDAEEVLAMEVEDFSSEPAGGNGTEVETLDASLDDLTKAELLDLAEERGVEVSKSWSKAKIIEALDGDA